MEQNFARGQLLIIRQFSRVHFKGDAISRHSIN